jgi:hypothetical protein
MKRRVFVKSIVSSPFLFSNARSQPANVWHVQAGITSRIDSSLGLNIWKMQKENFRDEQISAFIKKVSPSSLRYPPGETANFWDSLNGTVINEFRRGLIYSYESPLDLQAIAEVSKSFGNQINYILNMTTDAEGTVGGNLDQQLKALRRAVDLGLKINRIELGNEIFGESRRFGEYKRIVFPTAREYCATCEEWMPKIKEILPSVKFGASLADTESTAFRSQWNAVVKKFASPDALVIHPYFGDGFGQSRTRGGDILEKRRQQAFRFSSSDGLKQLMQQPRRRLSMIKRMLSGQVEGKEIWFTEYDFTDRLGQIRGTWTHGMLFAYFSLGLLEFGDGVVINPYNFAFDSVNFEIFTSDHDFEGIIGASATTPGQPTASGIVLALLGSCLKEATRGRQLIFNVRGDAPTGFPGLYGWSFEGRTEKSIILNFADNSVTLRNFSGRTDACVFSASPFERIYGWHSITKQRYVAGGQLNLPPFSVTVI